MTYHPASHFHVGGAVHSLRKKSSEINVVTYKKKSKLRRPP